MKTEKRWIKNMINEAAKVETKMPWERGARRAAFIAKRSQQAQPSVLKATA